MAFTRDNFLSFRTLEGIADLRTQFAQLLHEAGFLGARAGKGGSRNGGGKGGSSSGGRGGKKNIPAPRGGSSSDAGSSSTNKPESSSNRQPFNPRMLSRRGGPPADDPVWREANRNSQNTRLLKAVLVAGLYPNLVKVAPGHKPTAPPKLAYLSDEGREESLQVHPSSVNHGTKKVSLF
jgi:ATP-dependent RNA helicase DHX57